MFGTLKALTSISSKQDFQSKNYFTCAVKFAMQETERASQVVYGSHLDILRHDNLQDFNYIYNKVHTIGLNLSILVYV